MIISTMYARAIAITPSNTVDFVEGLCRAIYVGGAGNIAAIVDGAVILFTAVPVGTILPIQATRVNSTDTTATALIALY